MAQPNEHPSASPRSSTRSRRVVAAMAIVGIVACVPLGFGALSLAATAGYGFFETGKAVIAFVIFTPVTLVPAFALWSYGKRYLPGVALGLFIGWAGTAAALGWLAVSTYTAIHGPAAVAAFDARTGERLWEARLEAANGAGTPMTWAGLVRELTRGPGVSAGEPGWTAPRPPPATGSLSSAHAPRSRPGPRYGGAALDPNDR